MQSTRELPHGQLWLIEFMRKLGYPLEGTNEGLCFGIAHMGMHAVLCEEVEIFNDRLQRIYNNSQRSTLNLQGLNDIDAFFDGVILYQKARVCTPLLGQVDKTYRQSTLRSLSLVFPSAFEKSDAKPTKICEFTGNYNLAELTRFFASIRNSFRENNFPIAFVLGSSNHSMCVSFNGKSKEWIFINANRLPAKMIKGDYDVAKRVLSGFSSNDAAIFSTHVYVSQKNILKATQTIRQLRSDVDWKAMHAVTKDKARNHDSYGATWLYHCVDEGFAETVTELLDMGADANFCADDGDYMDSPYGLCVKNNSEDLFKIFINHNESLQKISLSMLAFTRKFVMLAMVIRYGAELSDGIIDNIRETEKDPEVVIGNLREAQAIQEHCSELVLRSENTFLQRQQLILGIRNICRDLHNKYSAEQVLATLNQFDKFAISLLTTLEKFSHKNAASLKLQIKEIILLYYKKYADKEFDFFVDADLRKNLLTEIKKIIAPHLQHCCGFFRWNNERHQLATEINTQLENSQTLNIDIPINPLQVRR